MTGFWYNKSIRKYVILMSNLFSDIKVSRERGLQPVPVSYASKEKFVAKLNQMNFDPQERTARIDTILPRMSLHLINMQYDATRKTNISNRSLQRKQTQGAPTLNRQFNPVPYDFTFELGIWTRHADDMFQISEQILPYFQPHFTCQMKELDENELVIDKRDIPIVMEDVTMEEDVEGDPKERRRLEWTMTFRLKGWLYPPANEQLGEIRTIYLNFQNDEEEVIIHAPREMVTGSLVAQWNTSEFITGNLELDWTTFNSASNSLEVEWNTASEGVKRDLVVPWTMGLIVNSDLESQWNTRSFVSDDLETQWNTRSYQSRDIELTWNTISNYVGNDLNVQWNTSGVVSNTNELQWGTRSYINTDLDAEWNTTNYVNRVLTATWHIQTN